MLYENLEHFGIKLALLVVLRKFCVHLRSTRSETEQIYGLTPLGRNHLTTQILKGKKKINHPKNRRRIRLLKDSALAHRVSPTDATRLEIHEPKRVEDALRETERFLTNIFTSIQDGISILDNDMNIIRVNPAMEQWYMHAMPLTGKKCYEAYHGRSQRCEICPTYQTIKTGKGAYEVVPKRGAKGEILGWFDLYAFPFIDTTTGKMKGVIEYVRDITERKQAEEASRDSEERYRNLVEAVSDVIFSLSEFGIITSLNPAFEKTTGWSRFDWIGKSFAELLHPEDLPLSIEAFQKVIRGEPLPRLEFRFLSRSSHYLVGELTASPQIKKGRIVGALGIIRDVTGRKRFENELKESEKKFRVLTETAACGIFIHHGDKFLYVNPASEAISGYTREELLSMNFWDMVHPDFRQLVKERSQARLKGESLPSRYELKIITKTGEERWIDMTVGVIEYEGKPAILGTSFDITERKRAEQALRESEERYRTILENIEDGYYEVDLAGNFTFFNDRICQMLGYSRNELMGMNNRQYTDEENAKKLFEAFSKVYQTGKSSTEFDWEVIRKGGTKRIGEASISLIRDAEGAPVGFRGIARDITQRKQAEEALRTEKQRFETLLENAPFGVIMIDKQGNFKYVNSKFIELFGYDLKDVPNGREWFRKAYPDPEQRHSVIETWVNDSNLSEPEEKMPRIFAVTCEDGTKKIIRFITVKLERGEYLISCENITLIQEAEEEKAALEEQLLQSQKMEAIGRLAGGIAHDFNNLLTVIKGYTQLSLLDVKENNPLWENMQEIQKAAQRASDLTRQLLAFSRRQILDPKVLDLNSLLIDVEKMLRRMIGEDIELVTLLSEDLGRVKIDPGQIEQVIFNLAVNARDAMPSGGKLTIETANVEWDQDYAHSHIGATPGHYVCLSVSDTGVGMSREVQEKAFDPFYTTKDKGKGTGLGLSTVYGIVTQSGGKIRVYSEPGHGTTFKIYFPTVERELDARNGKIETDCLPGGSETVLLVEDDPSVRDLANRLLRQQGYRVLESANGEDALRLAQDITGERIHLLLTDVVLPQMGGKQLADQLKIYRPDLKVLYTSGYTDYAIVHRGALDSSTHFLQKPFSLKTLSQKVREALDK